jgi:DNA primase catalytic subunit
VTAIDLETVLILRIENTLSVLVATVHISLRNLVTAGESEIISLILLTYLPSLETLEEIATIVAAVLIFRGLDEDWIREMTVLIDVPIVLRYRPILLTVSLFFTETATFLVNLLSLTTEKALIVDSPIVLRYLPSLETRLATAVTVAMVRIVRPPERLLITEGIVLTEYPIILR